MTVSVLPEKSAQLNSSFNNTKGIVFIDPKVDDYEMLIAGVKPGLEVVRFDDNCDGISQITQALKGRFGLSSLHIVAHGEAGSLWLGNEFVDSNTLEQYKTDLQFWATAFAPDASILLYGCNVAAGEMGRHFVQLFSNFTGAAVAASNNLTGSVALGGDWELEVKIGNVKAPLAFGIETMEAYSAVFTITRISVGSDSRRSSRSFNNLSISADGRYMAFESFANNLVSGDTNQVVGIFIYDTVANTTRRVSVDNNGIQGDRHSLSASISADGRYVAFESYASNLVSGDTNNTFDIFLFDSNPETRNLWTGTPQNNS